MRVTHTIALIIACLIAFTVAWTKEDHEIFRLRDEIQAAEANDLTFYEFVGVKPSATIEEITKQLRKTSRQLHPDKAIPSLTAKLARKKSQGGKAPGAKTNVSPTSREKAQITRDANERWARFNSVAKILQGSSRDRYDHFLRNGFPQWRGTGYYYQRFRPGLGSVLFGMFIVVGGLIHYGALYLGWKRRREFVERNIRNARKMAWGNESGIPGIDDINTDPATAAQMAGLNQPLPQEIEEEEQAQQPMNRKQKRAMEKDARRKEKTTKSVREKKVDGEISRPMEPMPLAAPHGNRKKVVAPNGKVFIVDSIGNVFLEELTAEGEKQEFLLDPEELQMPTLSQTALVRLPIWVYEQSVGRLFGKSMSNSGSSLGEEMENDPNQTGETSADVLSMATAPNAKAEARKRKAKTKQRVAEAIESRNGL